MSKQNELTYSILKSGDQWYWRLENHAKRVVATGVRMWTTREECIAEIELVKGSWRAKIHISELADA